MSDFFEKLFDEYTTSVSIFAVALYLLAILFFSRTIDSYLITQVEDAQACELYLMCVINSLFAMFYLDTKTIAIVTAIGFFSSLVLYASSKLDKSGGEAFIPEDWGFSYGLLILFFPVCSISIYIFVNLHHADQGIVVIFGILLAVPSVIGAFLIIPASFVVLVSAIFCLPRAVTFLTTSSKLRPSVERSQAGQRLDGSDVASALGQESSSDAHARALRRDVNKLTEEAQAEVNRLKAEAEKLAGQRKVDIERLEKEAELSRLLREAEMKKAEIEALRKSQAEFRKRS